MMSKTFKWSKMAVISEEIINEAYSSLIQKGLLSDGVVQFKLDAEDKVILNKATFDKLLSMIDRSLADYVDVGIKDAEEGRVVPAYQAIDNIRKKYDL